MKTRKNRSKKSRTIKQRGGLYDMGVHAYILYGGKFSPDAGIEDKTQNEKVSELISNTVLKSKLRKVMSTAAAIAKTPTTIFKGVTGLFLAGPATLSRVNDFINARARTRIINMLNKYARDNTTKISYPHLWEDVDEKNKLTRLYAKTFSDLIGNRANWLKDNPLNVNLNFGEGVSAAAAAAVDETTAAAAADAADAAAAVDETTTGPSAAPSEPPTGPSAATTGPSAATTGGKSRKRNKRNRKTRKA